MKAVSILPKTLFRRMLLIILLPMILVQVTTILVFYERHWDTVTRYMATNLAADIAVVVDRLAADKSENRIAAIQDFAWSYFYFGVTWQEGSILTKSKDFYSADYADHFLRKSLEDRLPYPFTIDLINDSERITVSVQFPDGIAEIKAGRKRIFSSTSLLVILWTISTSILLSVIAVVFLQGQVRPIRRLAKAARQLGLGRPAVDYKPEGAREVRLAGRAFQAMRQRIQRQMVERTEMLAGVSHDLRTPLTRMKLQLEYLPKGPDKEEMSKDIADMEAMIEGYIKFASNAAVEETQPADVKVLIMDSIASFNLPPARLSLTSSDQVIPIIPLRLRGICRAIDNLISNSIHNARRCVISLEVNSEQVQIIIDDDGPGIPKDQRISVLRPFVRLNPDKPSEGAGLGLSIANDAALSHGGNLLLGDSPLGGLRVRLQLPI
jgi:two-component system osmolarity sensor histidine kinase EnvZ